MITSKYGFSFSFFWPQPRFSSLLHFLFWQVFSQQSPWSLAPFFPSFFLFRPQPRFWSPLHFQSFLFLGFHFLECFSILDWLFTSGTERHIFNLAGCVQLNWGLKGATWDWSWIGVTAAFFSQNIWVSLVCNLMGLTLRNFYFNSNCCVNSIYTIYSFWFSNSENQYDAINISYSLLIIHT